MDQNIRRNSRTFANHKTKEELMKSYTHTIFFSKIINKVQRTGIKLAAAALALGTAMAQVQAAQCPLVPDGKASMEGSLRAQLLRNGQFEKLERELEQLQKKNLGSDGGDLLTLRSILELQQLSGQEENLMRMWVGERPQSFFAQLNAGAFYANQASHFRGDKAASQVSRGQMSKMQQLHEKAIGHLQAALKLDPRSALPQGTLIGIAANEGKAAGQTAQHWLQAANQADPKNLAARINATSYLSPRWGGSFELLDEMVQQANKSLLAQSAHYLQYNVLMAKASHHEVIEKSKSKAHALFKQAQAMCENSPTARDAVIRTYP
jgi:hypothetical protein